MNNIIETPNRTFILSDNHEEFDTSIALKSSQDGISIYDVKVKKLNENSGRFTFKWNHHMAGMLSDWAPIADRERAVRQKYRALNSKSNFYCGAPVLSVIDGIDSNFVTVALSDADNQTSIDFSVRDFEQKEHVEFMVYLYEDESFSDEYSFSLRIDERDVKYTKAIGDVTKWWKSFYPLLEKPRTVKGEYPLYSTWYNYHQNPTQESLEKELEEAAKLGFKSIIIDDGWSYSGKGSGDYRFCGDWKVSEDKFPDFKGFVEKAHSLGICVILWFPVTLVGYETEDYKKYKNKMLYNSTVMQCGVIDPRYPEIRDYVAGIYIDFVNKYNIDGLKLDFMDSLRILEPDGLVKNPDPGRDTESITEGTKLLMDHIQNSLTSKKSDFLIEFRQRYVGPGIVSYCNMLRVLDCAFDSITNRIGIADLRIMDYDVAVHADMLLWAKDESPENCAKMLLNIMFGVPQISVLLNESTEEQKKVIKNYIDYWFENREMLLHSKLEAPNPQSFYSNLSVQSDSKKITVLYTDKFTVFDGKQADIFNGTSDEVVCLDNVSGKSTKAEIFDCFGNLMSNADVVTGINKFAIPVGGKMIVKELI